MNNSKIISVCANKYCLKLYKATVKYKSYQMIQISSNILKISLNVDLNYYIKMPIKLII